jgi:hypothetical protein
MKRYIRIGLIAVLLACALLAVVSIGLVLPREGLAQAGAQPQVTGYSIDTWTVGAGGASSGGSFTLGGTAGQKDAGSLSGGSFTLDGGFWGQVVDTLYRLYLPAIMRGQ